MCTCAQCEEKPSGLSLERWRQLIQPTMNPFHFYQLSNALLPLRRECFGLVREWAYQSGGKSVGRAEIRDAITRAESMLADALGYWPVPTWLCETVPYPRAVHRTSLIKLQARKVLQIGKPVATLIGDVQATLLDNDGDGIKEIFEATLPFSHLPVGTTVEELSLGFSIWDRHDDLLPLHDYDIRPVRIQMDTHAQLVRIYGAAWLLVKPVRYGGLLSAGALDIDTATNYAATVSVYRTVTDHCLAGGGVWQARCGSCQVAGASCPPACGHCEAMDFCLVNGEQGLVRPVTPHCTCGNAPQSLTVSFQAGACLKDWELTIARLAAAELTGGVCECGDAGIDYWHEDLAIMRGKDNMGNFRPELLNNPWGTLRGHVYAWERVTHDMDLGGFLL